MFWVLSTNILKIFINNFVKNSTQALLLILISFNESVMFFWFWKFLNIVFWIRPSSRFIVTKLTHFLYKNYKFQNLYRIIKLTVYHMDASSDSSASGTWMPYDCNAKDRQHIATCDGLWFRIFKLWWKSWRNEAADFAIGTDDQIVWPNQDCSVFI